MLEEIRAYCLEAKDSSIKSNKDTEVFKKKFLSKSGIVNSLFLRFKKLSPDEKKAIGKEINLLKKICQEKIKVDKAVPGSNLNSVLDLTRPTANFTGSTHPITKISNQINEIFKSLGFYISSGPEIEDDWHNFEALNLPQDHPARDMQDTFYLDENRLLRTHTSPVQIRHLEDNPPPVRIIAPGRVYRRDAVDATHSPVFNQVEVLCIDHDINFSHLRGTVLTFLKTFFGDIPVRFRASYFPFTEPSAEVDVQWKGKWLEVMGCGMVDPKVLEKLGIDSEKWTGFAAGLGVERFCMVRHQIDDIRKFYTNDLRFLKQF